MVFYDKLRKECIKMIILNHKAINGVGGPHEPLSWGAHTFYNSKFRQDNDASSYRYKIEFRSSQK